MAEEILLGQMYGPDDALRAGLVDTLVEGDASAVVDAAVARATELAGRSADAYAATKLAARAALIERFATEARLSLG